MRHIIENLHFDGNMIYMEKLILDKKADMVIGDRLSSTYFEENDRLFHK